MIVPLDEQVPPLQRRGFAHANSFDLRAAAQTVLQHFDAEYSRLLAGERIAVEADWKWRTGLLGRQVRIELSGSEVVCGRMREMSFDALEVEVPNGDVRAITPESVEHVRAV